jgi:hypothetical protein
MHESAVDPLRGISSAAADGASSRSKRRVLRRAAPPRALTSAMIPVTAWSTCGFCADSNAAPASRASKRAGRYRGALSRSSGGGRESIEKRLISARFTFRPAWFTIGWR